MGQHVLVPVDRSSQAEKAFEYALANVPGSKITLVHVINPTDIWVYSDEVSFDYDGYRQEEQRRRESAETMLEDYRERATEQGVTVETVITLGKPTRKILEAAEDLAVDHIVMGSHGRSGVGRVLFGSVAEAVTRRSTVPVTIVR